MVGVTDEEWNGRDIVRCTGSDHGNILFANLLLNASHPEEERNEFALESECGFGGVGTGSAEAKLVLHGNQGWDEEL